MTPDEDKTKAELLQELETLRRRISEFEQAEQRLKDSEKQFKELFENTPVGIYRTTPEGRIIMANPALIRMLGYSSFEELSQRDLEKEGFAPGYPRLAFIDRIEREGKVIALESAWIKRDGTTLFIIENARAVRDESGKTLYYEGIVQDTTELKMTENVLAESERKFRRFVENLNGIAVRGDLESKPEFLLGRLEEITGFSWEDFSNTGIKWFDLMHPDDRERFIEEGLKEAHLGKPIIKEYRIVRKDGGIRWVSQSISPEMKEDGTVQCIQGVITDITERKQAEHSLYVKTAILQNIISNIPYYVFWKDKNSIYLGCNDNFAKLAGVEKPEDIVGKTDYDLPWKKEESDFYRKIDKEVISKGAPILNIEEPVHHGQGKLATILTSKVPLRNANGKITGILGIFTDISERKNVEQRLRASQDKYRDLVEEMTDVIYTLDTEGNVTSVNKAGEAMFGREPEEILGKSFAKWIPQEQLPDAMAAFKRVLGGDKITAETILLDKDGKPHNVEFSSTPIIKNGKVVGTRGIIRDITERKKVEQALGESQSRQRAILDSIPDIAWLKDKEGKYIAANEALCKAFDIKPKDLVGKTDFDISPEDLAKRYRDDDQEVMKSGQRKRVEELWGKKHSKGERIWIETIKTPVYDDQGQVIGTSGIARDITERKKAEEQLREYREKIARAERLASLGSLGAALAHELTQPLTIINLEIENALTELETTSYPKTVANKFRDVLTEVSRINSVAQKFRDAAKRSSERIISEVDLKAVAEKTFKLCDESARRAKVTLHLTDFDRLPSIYSHEEDLEQLFFALVDNAIQAACPMDQPLGKQADGKKAHQLVISGIPKDKHVELQFSDNCGGIAPENLDRIFEPFFTTKPAGQAMGLGLCIVEHIVSRAGGKVHVESKPGEGTTFYITLPINILS